MLIMSINKLILGTVQMGLPYGINNSLGIITIQESYKILKASYLAGIRLLDTAETYGNAHKIIGDFHKLNPKYKFNVITKMPPLEKIDNIEEKVNNYLNEMRIEKLECLMFHSYESYKKNLKILPLLGKLKTQCLIKQYGVSIYTNAELEELIKNSDVDVIQLPFNLLDNYTIRGRLLEEARKKGIIIHTRSTFLQGLFFKNPLEKKSVVPSFKIPLKEIIKLSKEEDISIASLALSYCIQQSCIDKILIGVDSLEQLQLNLDVVKNKISKGTINSINKIKTDNTELLNPVLW